MKPHNLLKQVGDDGVYQFYLRYYLSASVGIVVGINVISTVFMVYTPDHWCHVPQLSHLPLNIQHQLIRPLKSVHGSNEYDSCFMYDIDYDRVASTLALPNETNLLPTKKCSNGWTYDRSVLQETAVTEVSLKKLN